VLDGPGDGAEGYRAYLNLLHAARPSLDTPRDDPAWTHWAQQLLHAFDAFQLLCAVRKGPWGVEGLNLRITAALRKARLIDGDEQWY
ncbi:exodeoxyribonuclease V subunit alpha, partial [Salmonella enterica subsp. enterica serovar Soahanina]|nr:exodeoxyribonuclease V subunit alpha [Salmonella enterica subsp. enterica serovar Soahanina]